MKYELKGKWVLITGASSGFGAAAAVAFAAEGARLLLGARRMDRLEQVAGESRKAGTPTAEFHSLDVTQTTSVNRFAEWVRTKTQTVDVLVNNAGGAHGLDSVASGKDVDWEAMLQTNVLGILRMTRAVLPLMPQDTGASIINIGSTAGHTAYEGGAAYCAAKHGVVGLARALSLELKTTGVTVNAVCPGYTDTPLLANAVAIIAAKTGRSIEQSKSAFASDNDDGRLISPEEVAQKVLWLCLPEANTVNGQAILMSGGPS